MARISAALAVLVCLGLTAIAPLALHAAEEPIRVTSAKFTVPDDEKQKIEAALPAKAPAAPKQPRKFLIFA